MLMGNEKIQNEIVRDNRQQDKEKRRRAVE